jgi:hypothetical protein
MVPQAAIATARVTDVVDYKLIFAVDIITAAILLAVQMLGMQ